MAQLRWEPGRGQGTEQNRVRSTQRHKSSTLKAPRELGSHNAPRGTAGKAVLGVRAPAPAPPSARLWPHPQPIAPPPPVAPAPALAPPLSLPPPPRPGSESRSSASSQRGHGLAGGGLGGSERAGCSAGSGHFLAGAMSRNLRTALIFGGFVSLVGVAFYPIYFRPLMRPEEYREFPPTPRGALAPVAPLPSPSHSHAWTCRDLGAGVRPAGA